MIESRHFFFHSLFSLKIVQHFTSLKLEKFGKTVKKTVTIYCCDYHNHLNFYSLIWFRFETHL